MNKNKIFTLRVIETILLFGIVFKWTFSNGGLHTNFEILTLGFNLSLQTGTDNIIISTAFAGFPIAFWATLLSQRELKGNLIVSSLIISTLGALSYGNEILRYFTGYGFRLLVDLSLILLIVDWILYRRYTQSISNFPKHTEETSSNQMV